MKIGNKNFDFDNKYYIMGILNVTHDSFYDGGKHNTVSKALKHCEKLIKEGADIIDVGGMSTRPGHSEIPINQEIENVSSVIYQIAKIFDCPISIDTYRYEVAENAVSNGANMINDICGLTHDDGQMAQFIANKQIPVCITHNSSKVNEDNVIDKIIQDMNSSLEIAKKHGIVENNIILDPGIGFGKSGNANLKIIKKLSVIKNSYKKPILLGASNKSFIGDALNLDVKHRISGSIACAIFGAFNGASIFRVHNVKEHKQALEMVSKINEGDING